MVRLGSECRRTLATAAGLAPDWMSNEAQVPRRSWKRSRRGFGFVQRRMAQRGQRFASASSASSW
nr:hypothetical protein [Pyxidicoccus trucidator]